MRLLRAAAALTLIAVSSARPGDGFNRPPEGRAPEREVRAVWITTVAGLDWPAVDSAAAQKASLLGIVEKLSASGFNTIFFQVRGRGDALYSSKLEPWSEVLTGKPGADPGWDPLVFLLAEAHRRGMEVHAWFNTYLVKGGKGAPPATTPRHVLADHPEWGRLYEDRWWLDPGEPGVERYLLGVATDIVRRYDIDGLHLDYLRYPGREYDDARTYARYGKLVPLDRWRRENITRFLGRVREAVLSVKPGVKLGVTPIGIYKNPHGVRGLESYADVFQDTYSWIERRLVDYVVPQLYWPIGGADGDPDFTAMAAEWREQTSGCHLYLGIGSYKDEVLRQSEQIVGVARASGAEGEAFFRYLSIEPMLPFGAYLRRALPPVMPWKDSIPPAPPGELSVAAEGPLTRVRWTPPPSGDEQGGYYAIYRMTGGPEAGTRDEELVGLLPPDARSMIDSAAAPDDGVWYAVTRVDRAWNESPPVTVAAPSPPAAAAPPLPSGVLEIGSPWMAQDSRTLFLPYRLTGRIIVEVSVPVAAGAGSPAPYTMDAAAGGHVIAVDVSGLRPGLYRARVAAGADVIEREFRITR